MAITHISSGALMLAPFKLALVCSMLLVACAFPGIAQEPEHFYQFFEKGQVVQISSSSAESQFLSAVILTADEYQRVTDSRSLSAEEMVKKYPDLSAKLDETLKRSPELREENKAKLVFSSLFQQSGGYYRVVTAKSDYLLVERLFSQPGSKVVYALDKFKTISWHQGFRVSQDPGYPPRAPR